MKSTLVSDHQSPTIVEPGKAPFDAPPLGVTCCRKAWRLTTFSAALVFALRNARLDPTPCQLTPEGGTVKTFIGNKLGHPGSGSSAPSFLNGDSCHRAARQTDFVRGCALSQSRPIGSPLPSATSITLLPLPILVRPTPSPLFLTARRNRLKRQPPIRFCLRGQAMRAAPAKPNSKLRLATIHRTGASTWSANHTRLANQPTPRRFSEHIKYRSSICG